MEHGWGRAIFLLGEGARPFSIVFLVVAIGFGLFLPWVTVDKIGAVGLVFGALVGARMYENTTKVKADASVKTAETEATGEPSVQSVSDVAIAEAVAESVPPLVTPPKTKLKKKRGKA